MSPLAALLAFVAAAGLLTLTPGLDTALVLRTTATGGPRRGAMTAVGIGIGCLVWGAGVAFGLGALIGASPAAFTLLKWIGATYLVWMGARLIWKPRTRFDPDAPAASGGGALAALRQGLFTNLLNPKVGVFYISFLPQFTPRGVEVAPWCLSLAAIHVVMGLAWSAVLIAAVAPLRRALSRPGLVKTLDRATGCVFIAFGARLALWRG